jgi:hypothetical protein
MDLQAEIIVTMPLPLPLLLLRCCSRSVYSYVNCHCRSRSSGCSPLSSFPRRLPYLHVVKVQTRISFLHVACIPVLVASPAATGWGKSCSTSTGTLSRPTRSRKQPSSHFPASAGCWSRSASMSYNRIPSSTGANKNATTTAKLVAGNPHFTKKEQPTTMLVCGDGDLSFSASISKQLVEQNVRLTASVWETKTDHREGEI